MQELKSRFSRALMVTLEITSSVCLALMTFLIIAQVFLRYVFNAPLTWSEELARITFIYLTFVGIGAAYGRRRHMFIDSFVSLLRPRVREILHLVMVCVASTFLLATMVVTARSMAALWRMELTTPVLDLSMVFVYLIIPVGLSALIVQMWIQPRQKKEG